MKKSMIFYYEWTTLIRSLPDEKRLQLYDSILSKDKQLKSDDKHLQGIHNFIIEKIINNEKKYDLKILRLKKNASLGGKKTALKRQKAANASNCQQMLKNASNCQQIVGVNENVNVNVNDNVSLRERGVESVFEKKEKIKNELWELWPKERREVFYSDFKYFDEIDICELENIIPTAKNYLAHPDRRNRGIILNLKNWLKRWKNFKIKILTQEDLNKILEVDKEENYEAQKKGENIIAEAKRKKLCDYDGKK